MCGLLAAALCPLLALSGAQPPIQAWVQRYNGPGNTNDYAEAVTVDGSNNVIVAGYSYAEGSANEYVTITALLPSTAIASAASKVLPGPL